MSHRLQDLLRSPVPTAHNNNAIKPGDGGGGRGGLCSTLATRCTGDGTEASGIDRLVVGLKLGAAGFCLFPTLAQSRHPRLCTAGHCTHRSIPVAGQKRARCAVLSPPRAARRCHPSRDQPPLPFVARSISSYYGGHACDGGLDGSCGRERGEQARATAEQDAPSADIRALRPSAADRSGSRHALWPRRRASKGDLCANYTSANMRPPSPPRAHGGYRYPLHPMRPCSTCPHPATPPRRPSGAAARGRVRSALSG